MTSESGLQIAYPIGLEIGLEKSDIDHILECIDWIARHSSAGRAAFLTDRKTQSAVLREL